MAHHPEHREGGRETTNGLTPPTTHQADGGPLSNRDSIAAIATAPGVGSIGIVRVSGPNAPSIARQIAGIRPTPRRAHLADFRDSEGGLIDRGLVLYFPGPSSFTGEDCLELHGHGGPVVLDLLLRSVLQAGARPARAGEFSERAFLNGRIDLAQAEGIADLIGGVTEDHARLASRTLKGALSKRVHALLESLTGLRAYVESGLDFPDEDIELLDTAAVQSALSSLLEVTASVLRAARQGELLRDGLLIAIAGPTNAGKSSLLNALSGMERAIVTPIPGTTRDPLRSDIAIDGMPIRLIDTAGLRESKDQIEQEGMRRARHHIDEADHVIWVIDDTVDAIPDRIDIRDIPDATPVTLIRNKIDLSGHPAEVLRHADGTTQISLSARTGAGLELLRQHLKTSAGYLGASGGEFSARRRHLDALERALGQLQSAAKSARLRAAPELLAEDLRLAQQCLGEITGAFTPDDLLGRIFQDFCIGK